MPLSKLVLSFGLCMCMKVEISSPYLSILGRHLIFLQVGHSVEVICRTHPLFFLIISFGQTVPEIITFIL